MATAKQEQLYNQIIEYYNYSNRLITEVEDSSSEVSEEQFMIVENAVESLEKCADQLTALYIKFIQHGDQNREILDEVKKNFNDIMVQIEECRTKIIAIHDHSNLKD